MTQTETERLLSLHNSIFFLGIRRWIYHAPFPGDQDEAVAAIVRASLNGTAPIKQTIKRASRQSKRSRALQI
jgi:hypothetical protein